MGILLPAGAPADAGSEELATRPPELFMTPLHFSMHVLFFFGGASSVVTGVVKPDNVVVFYPTRYDAHSVGANVACPVSAFFAEYDNSPGATVEDAHTLLEQLLNNDDVSGWLAIPAFALD